MRSSFYDGPAHNGDGPLCPRCNAQIVLWRGEFSCSICGFDTPKWRQALSEQRVHTAEAR